MHVGVCRIVLRLPENHSLKEKRQTLRSLMARLRNQFNVAVAEVDDQDVWQMATIGVSCVSNSSRHAQQMLSRVINYLQGLRGDWELVEFGVEVVSGI